MGEEGHRTKERRNDHFSPNSPIHVVCDDDVTVDLGMEEDEEEGREI